MNTADKDSHPRGEENRGKSDDTQLKNHSPASAGGFTVKTSYAGSMGISEILAEWLSSA